MEFQHMLNAIWDFFREGFNHVNAVEGLVIALVAALLVPAWYRLSGRRARRHPREHDYRHADPGGRGIIPPSGCRR